MTGYDVILLKYSMLHTSDVGALGGLECRRLFLSGVDSIVVMICLLLSS
jgi:hypothetical protein